MSTRIPLIALCCLLALGPARSAWAHPQSVPASSQDASDDPLAADLARLAALAAEARWDEVLELSDRLTQTGPDDPTAGQPPAIALYWSARASYAMGVELRQVVGDAFSRDLGRALVERSVERFERLASATDATADDLGEVPADAREWWYRARLELGADDRLPAELERAWDERRDAAAAHLLGLLATDPASSEQWHARAAGEEPQRADYQLAWARALFALGRQPEALAAWDGALAAGASPAEAMSVLLALLPAPEDAPARLDRLERLAEVQADDGAGRAWQLSWELWWHRAYALDQQGRADEAADAFASVVGERSPEFTRAHAALLERLDRQDEAAALLRPLMAEHDWQSFEQFVGLADGLALNRHWDRALAFYDEAMGVEHRDERAARNRALTLWRAGRGPEAARAWADVVALFPGRADILNDASLAAGGRGAPLEEQALLREAIQMPGSLDAQENLASWLLEHEPSEREAAIRLLDGVLAEEPARDRSLYLRFKAGRP